MVRQNSVKAMTLAEVMVAAVVLLVAILTMVGYTATIARAARESKSQALASMYARTLIEQIRDSQEDFDLASSAAGMVVDQEEVLLSGEALPDHDEVGREGATQFQLVARATPLTDSISSLVVTVTWSESGRVRTLILESRAPRPFF